MSIEQETKDKLVERKYMARVMAVQALYSQEVLGEDAEVWDFDSLNDDLINYFHEQARGGKSDKKIDKKFFKIITQGASSNKDELNEQVLCQFDDDWNQARVGALLMSILRAASFELIYQKSPTRIIITEYTNITADFFDDVEVNFVNALLDKIARKIGTDELVELAEPAPKEDKYKKKDPVVVRNPKTKDIIPVDAPKLTLKKEG